MNTLSFPLSLCIWYLLLRSFSNAKRNHLSTTTIILSHISDLPCWLSNSSEVSGLQTQRCSHWSNFFQHFLVVGLPHTDCIIKNLLLSLYIFLTFLYIFWTVFWISQFGLDVYISLVCFAFMMFHIPLWKVWWVTIGWSLVNCHHTEIHCFSYPFIFNCVPISHTFPLPFVSHNADITIYTCHVWFHQMSISSLAMYRFQHFKT